MGTQESVKERPALRGSIGNKLLVQFRPILILLVEIIVFSIMNSRFLSLGNLTNILKQVSINAILAAAVSFAILLGGIDISVGALVGFVGALCASMVVHDWSLWMILILALVIGAAAGAFNGFFIAVCRLQPMIVTLATMSVFKGATLVFTGGATIGLFSGKDVSAFKYIGAGMLFDAIPIPVIIMLVIFGLVYFIQNKTSFGRHIYAVGGNEEASHLSGISVVRTKLFSHIICGILASIAGVILCARVGSAQPTAGESYEMDAIAACVVGGVSLRGGEGKIMLALVGAIIIGMMNNILNLQNVSSYWQTIVKGAVILVAVLLDMQRKKR